MGAVRRSLNGNTRIFWGEGGKPAIEYSFHHMWSRPCREATIALAEAGRASVRISGDQGSSLRRQDKGYRPMQSGLPERHPHYAARLDLFIAPAGRQETRGARVATRKTAARKTPLKVSPQRLRKMASQAGVTETRLPASAPIARMKAVSGNPTARRGDQCPLAGTGKELVGFLGP